MNLECCLGSRLTGLSDLQTLIERRTRKFELLRNPQSFSTRGRDIRSMPIASLVPNGRCSGANVAQSRHRPANTSYYAGTLTQLDFGLTRRRGNRDRSGHSDIYGLEVQRQIGPMGLPVYSNCRARQAFRSIERLCQALPRICVSH
jgi:hypothetical protein